jgi:hypothetical protein
MSLALMLGFVYMLLVPCVAPPLSLLHRQLLCLLLFLSSSLWLVIVSKCALMFDIICREAVLKGCCSCCIGILASIYCSRSSETASVFSPWGHILGEAEYSESYGKEREIRARALLQSTRGLGFWKGDGDGFRSIAAIH